MQEAPLHLSWCNMDSFYKYTSFFLLFLVILYPFLARYIAGGVCTSKAKMNSKTVIITGANSGIGKETALDLAKRGARVIMACRNLTRGEAALKEIVEKTGSTNVILKQLDLASLKSIRKFAEDINRLESRLHVLINNAGVAYHSNLTKTEDGFEMTMGVNHLGHFLLTNLLTDLLKRSSPARIVVVSSRLHQDATKAMKLDNINSEISYSRLDTYAQSKLGNILFTRELARRLKGTGVTANSLHPGVILNEFIHNLPKVTQLMMNVILHFFSKTQQQGAQTSIHLAVSEEVEGISGLYFSDCKPHEPSKEAQDDDMAKKLWELSAHLVGLNTTI